MTVTAVERVGPESFVYGTLDRGDSRHRAGPGHPCAGAGRAGGRGREPGKTACFQRRRVSGGSS